MKYGRWVSFQSVLCSLNLSPSWKSVPKCGSKTPSWHFHSIAKTGQMEERLHEWTQATIPPAQLQFNELGQCSTCWNNQRKRSVKHLGLSDWVNTPICDFLTGEIMLKTLSDKKSVSADPQLCRVLRCKLHWHPAGDNWLRELLIFAGSWPATSNKTSGEQIRQCDCNNCALITWPGSWWKKAQLPPVIWLLRRCRGRVNHVEKWVWKRSHGVVHQRASVIKHGQTHRSSPSPWNYTGNTQHTWVINSNCFHVFFFLFMPFVLHVNSICVYYCRLKKDQLAQLQMKQKRKVFLVQPAQRVRWREELKFMINASP